MPNPCLTMVAGLNSKDRSQLTRDLYHRYTSCQIIDLDSLILEQAKDHELTYAEVLEDDRLMATVWHQTYSHVDAMVRSNSSIIVTGLFHTAADRARITQRLSRHYRTELIQANNAVSAVEVSNITHGAYAQTFIPTDLLTELLTDLEVGSPQEAFDVILSNDTEVNFEALGTAA